MNIKNILVIAALAVLCTTASAQSKVKYSYAAQKRFIPAELGQVYLGMPFKAFAAKFDLSKANIDDTGRDSLRIEIPLSKGNITSLSVRIYGLTPKDTAQILRKETIDEKDDKGEIEFSREVDRLIVSKIPSKGFVYAMYLDFKPNFDLKTYVIKMYGKGTVRAKDDGYYFSDIQWTKKTTDGLLWLIRSMHESDSRSLQLLGLIDGTEWGLDGLN